MNCKKTLSKIRERNFMDTLAADAGKHWQAERYLL